MLPVKPFQQKEGHCGPASLKMVLGYFGIYASERTLGKLMKCTRADGATAASLMHAAKHYGMRCTQKKHSTLKDVQSYVIKKKIPVIIDWFYVNESHYSVVVHLDSENVYVLDPFDGHMKAIRRDIFMRVWFGFEGSRLVSKNQLVIRRMIVVHPKKSSSL